MKEETKNKITLMASLILESNRLIAEFMYPDLTDAIKAKKDGIKISGIMVHKMYLLDGYYEHMEYHLSWDWLMPVVKKCKNTLDLYEFDSEEYELFDFLTANLKNIYQRTVEIIKWYNKQKEK